MLGSTDSLLFAGHETTVDGAAAGEALPLGAMFVIGTQAGLLATELDARGFLAGIGKTILVVIIILVVIGALIGFMVARRFRGRG